MSFSLSCSCCCIILLFSCELPELPVLGTEGLVNGLGGGGGGLSLEVLPALV